MRRRIRAQLDARSRLRGAVLAGVAVAAFAVRATYAIRDPPALFSGSDNTWYHELGRSFAEGRGWRVPGVFGELVYSVRFPPAYPVVLALGQRLLFWTDAFDAHVWTSVAVGTLAAPLTAALAWRLCAAAPQGWRTLIAASAGAFIALNPLLAGASISLMSEALYLPLAALFLVQLDRVLVGGTRSPGWEAAGLGLVIGIAALCRSEGALILPVVVAVTAARAGTAKTVRRACLTALALGLLIIGAWSIVASLAAHRPVLLATNAHVLWGANCRGTYHGDLAGYWDSECPAPPRSEFSIRAQAALAVPWANPFEFRPSAGAPVEAEVNRVEFVGALRRIRDHPGGFVSVVPLRVARAAGLYWTPGQERSESFEGRNRDWERAGRWFHAVVVLPLCLVTAITLSIRSKTRRSIRSLVDVQRLFPPVVLMIVSVTIAALTYGSARLRIVLEPALAVWAGMGVAVLMVLLEQRRSIRDSK